MATHGIYGEEVIHLASFFEDLNRETDRGMALVGAALLDEYLARSLAAVMVHQDKGKKIVRDLNGPLSQFSHRIEAAYALGLIEEFEYSELSLVRKVRNVFAHSVHGVSFNADPVKGFCTSLSTDQPVFSDDIKLSPRGLFANAIINLALRLLYRDRWAAMLRSRPLNEEFLAMGIDHPEWQKMSEARPGPEVAYVAFRRDESGHIYPYMVLPRNVGDGQNDHAMANDNT